MYRKDRWRRGPAPWRRRRLDRRGWLVAEAEAAHGFDRRRVEPRLGQLVAQVADVDLHAPGVAAGVVPRERQELLGAQGPPRVADERAEQPELLGREEQALALHRGLRVLEVHG